MKTYQQLWQSITTLDEAGEAQAIVRTVLDVKYGMTSDHIICAKLMNYLQMKKENWKKLSEDCKKASPCSMFWCKLTLQEEPSMWSLGVLIPRP